MTCACSLISDHFVRKVKLAIPYASLPVCIIGAGAAGLYAAIILDYLGIKYEILEASGRHGGRLYTHQFNKLDGPYQYFVGYSLLDRTHDI